MTGSESMLATYRAVVESLDLTIDLSEWPLPLRMRQQGPWESYYAPFDHVNPHARVVLVGITPGLQQTGNALRALQQELRRGTPDAIALEVAKGVASFSGTMRKNLTDMLDAIGLPQVLDIASTTALFGARADLVHYTSALRYPVTLKGKNYGGSPGIIGNAFTQYELSRWFAAEARTLPDALYVPLGPAVTDALDSMASAGAMNADRILSGLPHPSGANAERIAYFVGRKPRAMLSTKTDPDRLDRARAGLMERIQRLTIG